MSDDLNYSISISGLQELINKLNSATQKDVIFRSLKTSGLMLAGWSKQNRLSGPRPQFLGVKTGRLRSSITASEPEQQGREYIERIGTNVEYAAIHEFGGHTGRGKGFDMPSRPFLRPSIEDQGNRQKVLDILTMNINEALAK